MRCHRYFQQVRNAVGLGRDAAHRLDHSRSRRRGDRRARRVGGAAISLRPLPFTFAAYVLYDLARLLQWPVEGPLLSGLFLLATITALVAVWGLYREGR